MATESDQGSTVRRAFAVIKCLSGHEFDGLRLTQIAKTIDANASTVLRTLEHLAEIGVVLRDPRNETLWRLGPMLIQIAAAFQNHMARKHTELADFNHNYTINPN